MSPLVLCIWNPLRSWTALPNDVVDGLTTTVLTHRLLMNALRLVQHLLLAPRPPLPWSLR